MQSQWKIASQLTLIFSSFFLLAGCNHKVLVVGGTDNNGTMLSSADLYDPGTGTFTAITSTMSTGRLTATATALPDDTILVAGGQGPASAQTADIFQGIGSFFVKTSGTMNHTHIAHTATFLDPAVVSGPLAGNVLITGGDQFSTVGTAESYSPSSKTFTETGNMTTPRTQHTAVLISHCGCPDDGKVLIVGGYDNQYHVLPSAELFDPATQTFTATGDLHVARFRHTATLLEDGSVLIAGGASQMAGKPGNINPALNTAEIYNPNTGKFTLVRTPMTAYREAHAASLLKDGTVLLTGGQDNHYLIENTAELYDPATQTFTALSSSCSGSPPPAGCMISGRDFHVSVTLDDGRVLLAGGVNSAFQTVASAETYSPVTKTFTQTGNLSTPRSGAAAALVISTGTNTPRRSTSDPATVTSVPGHAP